MLRIYVISSARELSRSIRAKLQKRDRKGRFTRPLPTARAVEKNPLATFFYPMSSQPWNSLHRTVRLISSNATHFTGLEKQDNGRWKYKKFLQAKASEFHVQSFNPKAMS